MHTQSSLEPRYSSAHSGADRLNDATLVIGRGLHAPWNEGTRVIGRDLARAFGRLHPVRVVSLTPEAFRGQHAPMLAVEHVYAPKTHSIVDDYRALPEVINRVQAVLATHQIRVAHLIGFPLAIAPWLRRRGIPVVAHVTLTQQVYMSNLERLRATLAWRVFDRWIDRYACSSQVIGTNLCERGYRASKVTTLLPPIDTERFIHQNRAQARAKFGMEPDAFTVVYVGTISPKRFPADEVIGALAAAHIPDIRLEVFAPVKTHSYNVSWAEQHVQRAVERGQVPVRVQLLDLTDDDKTQVFSAADVVILPFTAPVAVEPPLTLLEAMACETLPLVAPFANRSGIVLHGVNGYTYDSVENLVRTLQTLHQMSVEERRERGRAARASIVAAHSFAAVGLAAEHLWTELRSQTVYS